MVTCYMRALISPPNRRKRISTADDVKEKLVHYMEKKEQSVFICYHIQMYVQVDE